MQKQEPNEYCKKIRRIRGKMSKLLLDSLTHMTMAVPLDATQANMDSEAAVICALGQAYMELCQQLTNP